MTKNQVNRLASESSPYLLQHADNPVDWYPWGAEALDLARDSGKPILLSVGYSACHWCHVMAHESFEDSATAELMNSLYINVKVDREERPDIDRIYQTAHQLLTQRPGGWPLTMFIDPEDQRPFFGGTYFPDKARHGMPSFTDLITRVAEYFRDSRSEIQDQGQKLAEIIGGLDLKSSNSDQELTDAPIAAARVQVEKNFDRENGGTVGAPKFPHPGTIDRILRHWRDSAHGSDPDIDALFQVTLTLTRMAEGGIYDHLGGGFCRYSVDGQWQIPHFEKMLYDNGPLLALYTQAWLATGEELFARTANETADWMQSDMQSPTGGFYSSRDADSEGEEGLFYVWDRDEVSDILPQDQYSAFAPRFGLDVQANFEGKWHLTVHRPIETVAADTVTTEAKVRELIDAARGTLLAHRSRRIAPDRDDKQLTSWNALAIRGFAIAGKALQRPDLIRSAQEAADFIQDNLLKNGRLLATSKDGQAKFPAYLDDHAFMLDALLELLQAEWNSTYLEFAIEIAELLLEHFYDEEFGGFFFTADDHEQLMHRPKPLADEAMPSGAGIAILALQRLGFMLGEARYLEAAEASLRYAWPAMLEYAHGHVSLITALEEYLHHPEIIIIRGMTEEVSLWRDSAAKLYAPRRLVFAIPADANDLPGALADRKSVDGHTIAYRCVGNHCSLPIDSWEALAALLRESAENGSDE